MRLIDRPAVRRAVPLLLVAALVASACSEPEEDTSPVDSGAEVTAESAEESTDATEPSSEDTGESSEEATGETSEESTDESTEEATGDEPATTTEPEAVDDGSVVFGFGGQEWFLGTVPTNAVAADASLEPIKIGMINQEDTPLGSFPEVRAAAQAAAAWVNAELGGVDGRPVEIIPCITSFDVEQSQSCALDLVNQGVVAMVGGVDVTSNGSYPVIEQNGLAVVGGIPANLVEQRSSNAFFFSGGGSGAAGAAMVHAQENGAETVLVAYGEFDSFEVAARDYGAAVGESLGLNVELVPFSLFATDYLPILTKAQEVGADGVVVLAADAACVPVMQTAVDLGLDATIYMTGACAADTILDAAGEAAVGVVMNTEGPVGADVEGDLFTAVTDRYATEPAGAAGTVGFRGFMNLYAMMLDLGPDGVTSEAILAKARSQVDAPSFWGHPYTCDGNQVPGLPALCAPQQILMGIEEPGGDLVALSDWIPMDELFQAAVG